MSDVEAMFYIGKEQCMSDLRLIPVADHLWRVLDVTGRALGHLDERGAGARRRFHARRFHTGSGAFRDLGAFCTAQEALDCLRWSR
jgi:hypothetical protein